jgi:hypothetical protein
MSIYVVVFCSLEKDINIGASDDFVMAVDMIKNKNKFIIEEFTKNSLIYKGKYYFDKYLESNDIKLIKEDENGAISLINGF